MPSNYSTSLRLELMADGEKSGTWGTITNTNLGTLIEQGVAGVASVAHDDSASYTLTTNNGSSDEARNAVVLMTGALTADREVIVPDVDKSCPLPAGPGRPACPLFPGKPGLPCSPGRPG